MFDSIKSALLEYPYLAKDCRHSGFNAPRSSIALISKAFKQSGFKDRGQFVVFLVGFWLQSIEADRQTRKLGG